MASSRSAVTKRTGRGDAAATTRHGPWWHRDGLRRRRGDDSYRAVVASRRVAAPRPRRTIGFDTGIDRHRRTARRICRGRRPARTSRRGGARSSQGTSAFRPPSAPRPARPAKSPTRPRTAAMRALRKPAARALRTPAARAPRRRRRQAVAFDAKVPAGCRPRCRRRPQKRVSAPRPRRRRSEPRPTRCSAPRPRQHKGAPLPPMS
mmetsp:Transcript_3263/g.10027  ORF Transcript_3263/g.10027 Transcript_3263/m.10027 type:complete len:206 (+) Transcript_3263:127-744(+)